MMGLVFIFLLMMIFVGWSLPKLLQEASRREIGFFIAFNLIAFLLLAGLSLRVRFPNPSDGIMMLLKPLRDWMDQFLA